MQLKEQNGCVLSRAWVGARRDREPKLPWSHDTWAEPWKRSRSCPGRCGQFSICRISGSRISPYRIARGSWGWGTLGQIFHTGISENPRKKLASQSCSVELLVNATSHSHTHTHTHAHTHTHTHAHAHTHTHYHLPRKQRTLWEKLGEVTVYFLVCWCQAWGSTAA